MVLLTLFLLLVSAVPAYAVIDCADASPVAFEDATPAATDSFSYTVPSGANMITFVGTGSRTGSSTDRTVTIAGDSMTPATTLQFQNPSEGRLFYRVGVASGSQTVAVTWSGSTPLSSAHIAFTCTGVDQSTPIRDTNQAAGSSTTPTVTVAGCQAGDTLVDYVTRDGIAALTVGANQTQISQVSAPAEMNAAASFQAGSDGNVMSWTHTSEQWTTHSVCLIPAGTALFGPLGRRRAS